MNKLGFLFTIKKNCKCVYFFVANKIFIMQSCTMDLEVGWMD